jgi:hypothetical protein
MNLSQSVIVTAAGQPMFAVGGNTAHQAFEHKGYHVSLEWDETDGEPIMLIWSERGGREAGVFGICLSSAGKYAEPDGRPTMEGVIECGRALEVLGRNVSQPEMTALVDVVMRHIPDLLMMPPAPKNLRAHMRRVRLMDVESRDHNGKTLSHAEL